jgi:hypothetical protein
MTIMQAQAIWELCRQGFPLDAEDAAEHWEKGQPYLPEQQVKVPRDVERLIDTCNWEVSGQALSS